MKILLSSMMFNSVLYTAHKYTWCFFFFFYNYQRLLISDINIHKIFFHSSILCHSVVGVGYNVILSSYSWISLRLDVLAPAGPLFFNFFYSYILSILYKVSFIYNDFFLYHFQKCFHFSTLCLTTVHCYVYIWIVIVIIYDY